MRNLQRLTILIVLSALVTACDKEGRDWRSAQSSRDEDAVKAYVQEYPKGQYVGQALALSAELATENIAWEFASTRDTDIEYRSFIESFPDSTHNVEAKKSLDRTLRDLQKRISSDDFKPDTMLLLISPDQETVAPALRNRPFPLAIWQGEGLAFSLSNMRPAFKPPHPSDLDIVVAVLDNRGLIPELESGTAYLWRGGKHLLEVRRIDQLRDAEAVSEAFGFVPGQGYVNNPPNEFLEFYTRVE